jgi:hypothetical protein
MRVAISLLVTTFLFSSLAVNFRNTTVADFFSLHIMASNSRLAGKPKSPESPTPHRGSGRTRTLIEYFTDTQFSV